MAQTTPLHPASAVKSFEFFKPGSFTAVNGKRYTFDKAAVQEMVDGYRPEFSDAPLVVGHPQLTSPRFGRAERLFVNDAGVACCEPGAVVAEFAEMVNKGLYPRVSASIFLPDAKGNPTPGKHYLNHIGFLGGVAPAVKGLEMVQFAGDDDGIASFAYEDRVEAGLWRKLRDFFISEFGADKAEKALPGWDVDLLQNAAAQPEPEEDAGTSPAFAAPTILKPKDTTMTDVQTVARVTAMNEREAALAAREAAVAAQEGMTRRAEVASFAESLVATGQLLPATKDATVEILNQLDGAALAGNGIASFAAEHADHGKTGAQLFRDFLRALPKQVSFDKLATSSAVEAANFAAPEGYSVDADGLELMAKAKDFMKTNPGVSLIDAASAVQALG